ncbi:alpha/beta hydrolase [Pseudoxanthomonas sacheonensis]|uniref:Alpha/beta superfamily hydrolase n=1 Tax=Pseudoxanthomonas sacheonensis TaxID=443615 RepID=A0ABU1RRZ2_9GAMM|nr:alpha/beta hydrolase-fold protein [Pseudoxanthomonas sacheonensis]MDR6841539.1 putative alpha/beta superfamily hydrolase [Pseudoxanthomonas sacheonensis]
MRTILICFALCAGLAAACAAQAQTSPTANGCKSTVSGDLHVHTLKSEIFGNERKIRVLLPAGYSDAANKDRHYPVLYLLDGQNVFDACLSEVSHHEWSADETVRQLIADKKIPPLIVVGVDHAGKDRAREYLPYKDFAGNPDMDEPAGKLFPDFMNKEVMRLVNGNYRTLTGAANTGIGGSSYGGVASLYALLANPNAFGYGLIESPVLWVGMGQLVRDTNPLAAMPKKVFVAFGGKEASDPAISQKMIGFVRQVESNFHAAGYDETNFRVVIEPEAEHTEAAWEKRLPGALTFLFGDWKPTPPPSR